MSSGAASGVGDPPFGGRLGSVGIVGAGQVGTMLGMALRATRGPTRTGDVGEVVLFDVDRSTAEASLSRGAGDRVAPTVEDALAADTIVLAIPVPQIVRSIDGSGSRLRPGSLVIDTGSTKTAVVEAMRRAVPRGVHAIGGHPLAGTERPGPAGADPERLRGSPFVLSAVRDDPEAMVRARALVVAVGAEPVEMDAEEHDRAVGFTSHLPHLAAFALAIGVGRHEPDAPAIRSLISTGFLGASRLAGSEPAMVAGFLSTNARSVRAAAERFRASLDELTASLDDPVALEALLVEGRGARERLAGAKVAR